MSINSHKNLGEKIADLAINKKKLIEKIFSVLLLASVVCIPFVHINYDLTKYLPSQTQTKQGINLMESEFGYPGTARVMIDNISLYETKNYVDQIEKLDGVDSVTWAGSAGIINVGDNFLATQDLSDYYKDKHALLNITFNKGDSDPKTGQALDKIYHLVGDKGHFTGPAVDNKNIGDSINSMVPKISIGVVVLIIAVLILTTTSWFEPVIFMLTMGIAIILNMGSNLIFGEISFLTFSVSSMLQLAVAMDYSVFLIHAFSAEKIKGYGIEKTMSNALKKILPSIVSSAMTATIGFLVLALMKFSIGKDMGLVLAKGMVWSLLSIVFLMPALIIRWEKLIEKTKHKSFIPRLDKISKNVFGIGKYIAIIVLVLIIPAYVAQGMNNFKFGMASMGGGKGTKVYADQQVIKQIFGQSNMMLIVIPNQNQVLEKQLTQELKGLNFVKSVTSLADMLPGGIPESILPVSLTSQLHTTSYARLIVDMNFSPENDFAFQSVDTIKTITQKYYPENTYFLGDTPATKDMKDVILSDYGLVDMICIFGVAAVVLFSFRSLVLTLVMLVPIKMAVILNMAIPFLFGNELAFLGYLMVSSIQLGSTIDYAILMTNNYLHERNHNISPRKAAVTAIKNSIVSIMTSGTVLSVAGLGLYFFIPITSIRDMGKLIGLGTIISMFLVICLLPFLLTISDSLYEKEKKLFKKVVPYTKKVFAKLKKINSKKVKRFAISFTSLFLIMVLNVSPILAKAPTPVTDEAAYFSLDYYGNVQSIDIVKGVDLNSNTNITDYGDYSKVTNMSTLDQPENNSGKLVWNLDEKTAPKRFYYEVTPKDNLQIPWSIDVNYKLNGVPIHAEKLAGASGLVAVDVIVTPNTKANAYYKNNFVLMVGMMTDSDKNYSFSAPGSQQISLGSENVAFFLALPKQTKTFHFEVGTDSFETNGIIMAMTPITLDQMKSIKEIKAHKTNIENAGKAIDSTMDDIFGIMTGMKSGLQDTSSGLSDLNNVTQNISDNNSGTMDNLGQTQSYLSALQSRLNTSNYIISISPYSATASAIGVNDALSESAGLLGSANDTIGSVKSVISDNGSDLSNSLNKTLSGTTTLLNEMDSVLNKTEDLQNNKNIISNIIKDEWNRFDKDLGILDIDIDAAKVSFTSPNNSAPKSLMVVLRTQEIKVDKNEKDAEIQEEKDKLGFWGRVRLVFTTINKTVQDNFGTSN